MSCPCPKCGRRMKDGADQCKVCRFARRKQEWERLRTMRRQEAVCQCGMPLEGNRKCPACEYDAQMPWGVLAAVYSERNPDDPLDGATAKRVFHAAIAKLRAWSRLPDNELSRLHELGGKQ